VSDGAVLADVIVAPGRAFREIAARPRFAAPLGLAVFLALVVAVVWIGRVDAAEFMRAQLDASGVMENMPADQRAAFVAGQARLFKRMALFVPLVGVPATYAALAGVFFVVYRFFYAAELSYRQSLAVVAWTAAAFRVVTTPLVLLVMTLRGDWNVDPQEALLASPAALLDRAATPPSLFALAEAFDLFTLWAIALLSIGYAAVIGGRPKAAAWGVVVPWILFVLGKAALAALF